MAYPALGLDGEALFEEGDQLGVLRVQNEAVLHALPLQRHGGQAEALPGKQPVHGTSAVVTEQRRLHLVLQQPRLVAWRGVAPIGHANAHQRVHAALQQASLHVERHRARQNTVLPSNKQARACENYDHAAVGVTDEA